MSYHLKIVGFKSHIDREFTFNKDQLILLKGPSGAGKTTVLQALYWCLYGNMRGVYNNTGATKKCCVSLHLPGMIIYRQKRPELLRVTLNDNNQQKSYEDKVAQEIIDKRFGNKELWKATSWIQQKGRCSLLSGSAMERMNLLDQLSFAQDDPKYYIKTIGNKLKEVNKSFTQLQADYTAKVNLFSQQLQKRPIKKVLTQEQINELQQQKVRLTIELSDLYEQVKQHQKYSGSLATLKTQLSATKDNLEKLTANPTKHINQNPKSLEDNIDELQIQINTIQNHGQELQKQIHNLQNKQRETNDYNDWLNKLEIAKSDCQQSIQNKKSWLSQWKDYPVESWITDNPDLIVNKNIIWQTQLLEQNLQQSKEITNQLGIEYTQQAIDKYRQKLQNQLVQIKNIKRDQAIKDKINAIDQKLNGYSLDRRLEQSDIDWSTDQIHLLQKKLTELKRGLDVLSCPDCEAPLRWIKGELVKGECKPVSQNELTDLQNKIQEQKSQISIMKQILNWQTEKEHLLASLPDNNNNNNTNNDILDENQINQHLSLLAKIQIIELPKWSSQKLTAIYNYNKLLGDEKIKQQLYENLQKEFDNSYQGKSFNQSVEEIDQEINNLKSDINVKHEQIHQIQQQIINEKQQLRTIQRQQHALIKWQSDKEHYQNKIHTLEQQLSELSLSLYPLAEEQHSEKKETINQIDKDISNAEWALEMQSQQQILTQEREIVLNENQHIESLTALKQTAIQVECQQLEMTVWSINQQLEEILPYFFDDPITVKCNLYKQLKTKNKIKPGLTIIIKYKGAEYDNVNQLSGGEGDRISLALILALNSCSDSPFLLLDECISSLDQNLKESCLQALKDHVHKTVVCVDHGGVEGFYNSIISL